VASLYPTAEEARITCAIGVAAANVCVLNFKKLSIGHWSRTRRSPARAFNAPLVHG